ANDGTAPDNGHAWRTLGHGTSMITCGQELIVMGGNYAFDHIRVDQTCTAGLKAVVLVNPGDIATMTSANADPPIEISGSHIVVDGIKAVISYVWYQMEITGDHHALFNLEIYQLVVPTFTNGVDIRGGSVLI